MEPPVKLPERVCAFKRYSNRKGEAKVSIVLSGRQYERMMAGEFDLVDYLTRLQDVATPTRRVLSAEFVDDDE